MKVIFPGAFDPFTLGHEAIVSQALKLFDGVVIGIGVNTQKQAFMSLENRMRLIRDIYRGDPRVEVRSYEGLTGDLAAECGAGAIVRGVRSAVDCDYEREVAFINRTLFPDLTTVVLFTPASLASVSSTAVRELLKHGRDPRSMMPEGIEIENYLK